MEASYKPTPEFERGATSLKGVSGGNPQASLWFCGIEYGGSHEYKEFYTDDFGNLDVIDGIPCWGDRFIQATKDECTTWQYIQKIAKVALAYEGKAISDYRNYIRNEICRRSGQTFLMNLYPLNFPNDCATNWADEIYKRTGFPNKIAYRAWCMQYRFPVLRRLITEYSPSVLICTGIGYEQDFKLAFMGVDGIFQDGETIEISEKKFLKKFSINNGKTLLLVTPFFGQGGIMSDKDLMAVAGIAKKGI